MGSGTPKETIRNTISDYLTGDKSDGLIFLEHEITEDEVNMFIEMYPQMLSNGWNLANIVSFLVIMVYSQPSEQFLPSHSLILCISSGIKTQPARTSSKRLP